MFIWYLGLSFYVNIYFAFIKESLFFILSFGRHALDIRKKVQPLATLYSEIRVYFLAIIIFKIAFRLRLEPNLWYEYAFSEQTRWEHMNLSKNYI